jgi:hypothetical protein
VELEIVRRWTEPRDFILRCGALLLLRRRTKRERARQRCGRGSEISVSLSLDYSGKCANP